MSQYARIWRASPVRVFALALAIAAAPLPAMAGDVHPTEPTTPGIAASAQKALAATTLNATTAPRNAQDQSGTRRTDLGSSSFFKSPAGIITLVAVGAGLGFALYSTSNDRVKSPAR